MNRFEIITLTKVIILRIDGHFVGSYPNYTKVSRVIDAYRGVVA